MRGGVVVVEDIKYPLFLNDFATFKAWEKAKAGGSVESESEFASWIINNI